MVKGPTVKQRSSTRRAVASGIEKLIGKEIRVLDHGFVRVVDYMGDDSSIVEAARVSYGKGTRKISDDRALIRYLMRHLHTTPFEMAEIKLHVKLPIFVARQWIRHRTANVNEYSARYSVLGDEFYIPSADQVRAQSQTNKQGRGKLLPDREANRIVQLMHSEARRSYDTYKQLLTGSSDNDQESGLARELARSVLPVSAYTQWFWKIDLHNLMHFLELRLDAHAQFEIRAYAEQILAIVAAWVPETFAAFSDYRLGAVTLSRTARAVLSRLLAGEVVTEKSSGLSGREWRDLCAAFNLSGR